MPDHSVVITGIVAGDNWSYTATVSGIPAGYTINKAWMTVKTSDTDNDPGLVQKAVTTSNVAGTGQVTDTGADGTGAARFDHVPADTALFTPGTAVVFDAQFRFTDGSATLINTPIKGTITTIRGVTVTTA